MTLGIYEWNPVTGQQTTAGGVTPSPTTSTPSTPTPSNTVPSATTSTATSLAAAATPDPASAATEVPPLNYTPRSVQPQETVQGQINSLMSQDNPYVKRARQQAAEFANSRGLINSTMAANAGETAALDAALPIAQQDADTYSRAALQEQQYSQQNMLDQNTFAQERSVEVWKQENLGFAQYLKGVADINAQDIALSDKQAGVDRLWEEYKAARPLGNSLLDVQIRDGVIYG